MILGVIIKCYALNYFCRWVPLGVQKLSLNNGSTFSWSCFNGKQSKIPNSVDILKTQKLLLMHPRLRFSRKEQYAAMAGQFFCWITEKGTKTHVRWWFSERESKKSNTLFSSRGWVLLRVWKLSLEVFQFEEGGGHQATSFALKMVCLFSRTYLFKNNMSIPSIEDIVMANDHRKFHLQYVFRCFLVNIVTKHI